MLFEMRPVDTPGREFVETVPLLTVAACAPILPREGRLPRAAFALLMALLICALRLPFRSATEGRLPLNEVPRLAELPLWRSVDARLEPALLEPTPGRKPDEVTPPRLVDS